MQLEPLVRAAAAVHSRLPEGDVATMTSRDIARARKPRRRPWMRWVYGAPLAGVRIEQGTVCGDDGLLPVQLYRPVAPSLRPRPLVVYFHGGGWVIGAAGSADWLCTRVAAALDAVVAGIDYRLAPEHRAPAAPRDGFAATEHFAGHPDELAIDPTQVAVIGDSAGGNVAAVVALMARAAGGPALAAQALIYPATDATLASPSIQRLWDAPMLRYRDVNAYLRHYLGDDGDPRDPLVSPLLAADHHGLPPTLVQTAEVDPLVDDGARYARALRAANVPVRYTCYVGVPHGYFIFPGLTRVAAQALAELVAFLAQAFGQDR